MPTRIRSLIPMILSLLSPLALSAEPDTGAAVSHVKVVTAWSNAGQATALAAFETANWAIGTRNIDVAVNCLNYTDQDAEGLRTIFNALSEPNRTLFVSPERMAAMGIVSRGLGPHSPKGCEIHAEKINGPDNEILSVRLGTDSHLSSPRMKRVDGEWKLTCLMGLQNEDQRTDFRQLVEALAQKLGAKAGPP